MIYWNYSNIWKDILKEAGFVSGLFYTQFPSKTLIFQASTLNLKLIKSQGNYLA